ncbi:MAG TPA: hypothetical protein VEK15_27225 [Vicinamibacteria bacterium]|nr:hypothetical protein [Vicinamibacteria bacterium]
MSRRIQAVLLLAAVVSYPTGFVPGYETVSRNDGGYWLGEARHPSPDVVSQFAPKTPARTASFEFVPPQEKLLHQKPFSKSWSLASRLGAGSRLIRAPPHL